MEQIQMSNPANIASGSGMASGVKGQQTVADQMGASQMGQDAQGAMDFKGLLQGKQPVSEVTEEQEQTLSLMAAGMQGMDSLMLLGMQNTQAQGTVKTLSIPGSVAEGIVNLGVLKLAQTGKPVGEETQQNMPMQGLQLQDGQVQDMQAQDTEVQDVEVQDAENDLFMAIKEEGLAEGTVTEKGSVSIPKEMSEGLRRQTEGQIEQPSEFAEKDAKDMSGVSWQETMVRQQPVSGKAVEQTNTQDVMKTSTPQEIPKNLAEKIVEKANAGVREFEIQIEPKNLGKIAVRLEYQNGDATISIICSETRTLEIVKQNVNDISNVVQKNLQEEAIILVDEKKPEAYEQQGNGNSDAGRESEWERQKEERKRRERNNSNRFLQELRLGLLE